MNIKELNRNYYLGIKHTLIVYVIVSIIMIIFRSAYLGDGFGIWRGIHSIINFTGAPYAWYLEMYIGLFLLIPFINLIYTGLDSEKNKKYLIYTMLFLTAVPLFFNHLGPNNAKEVLNPEKIENIYKIIPSYWTVIYPLTYYFIGAYISEYGIKISSKSLIITFLIVWIGFAAFLCYRSQNIFYYQGEYQSWGSFPIVVMSTIVFELMRRIDFSWISTPGRSILKELLDACLGAYLISYMFDKLVYAQFTNEIDIFQRQFPYILITVPLIFIGSLMVSVLINHSIKIISKKVLKLKR